MSGVFIFIDEETVPFRLIAVCRRPGILQKGSEYFHWIHVCVWHECRSFMRRATFDGETRKFSHVDLETKITFYNSFG
jgi:hypothetical protein